MSRLPQELIELIIDYYHEYDRGLLKVCSLVCSRWPPPTRKHLFQKLELCSKAKLERWCTRIRPEPPGPPSFVESLSLVDHGLSMSNPDPSEAQLLQQCILSDAAPYLGSFSGLRALEILGWDADAVQVSLMLYCVGPSFSNVAHLTLRRIVVHPLTLAMFIGHFPRLDYLSITSLQLPKGVHGAGDSHRGSPGSPGSGATSHPRGEFRVSDLSSCAGRKEFLDATVFLEPRFRQISI